MKQFLLGLWLLSASCWAQDGRMYVVHPPVKGQFAQFFQKAYQDGRSLEGMVELYNKVFRFPRDIPVILGESGQINCWYDPRRHHVVISYEFLEFLFNFFSKRVKSEDVAENVAGTLVFVTLHEFAHAFIGELEIPITGREEDAADEFACLLLNYSGREGQTYALAAARWFLLMSEGGDNSKLPFWDEHSLDLQRFYETLTFLYGADPNRFSFVEKVVPERRLARAQQDYANKKRAWDKLLSPHFR